MHAHGPSSGPEVVKAALLSRPLSRADGSAEAHVVGGEDGRAARRLTARRQCQLRQAGKARGEHLRARGGHENTGVQLNICWPSHSRKTPGGAARLIAAPWVTSYSILARMDQQAAAPRMVCDVPTCQTKQCTLRTRLCAPADGR